MLKSRMLVLATSFCLFLSQGAFASKYVLYFAPGASSLAPRILLNAMAIDADFERVDLATHTVVKDKSDYYKINKSGMVPALKMSNGKILTETAVILQYLADHDDSHKFLPAVNTEERYFVLEKVNFIATEVHKSITSWFQSKDKEFFAKKTRKSFAILDEALAGKEFIANNRLSIADYYLVTALLESQRFNIDNLKGLKNINKYLENMKKCPNVRAAFEAEGLGDWIK